MRASVVATAFIAALVGYAGSLPVVIGATQAVGATQAQAASWIAALCISVAVAALWLSARHRIPAMTAWSLPGAALIAGTTGISLPQAVGAFIFAALLMLLTALVRPLSKLIEKIPTEIASAMLAGVLFPVVISMITQIPTDPLLLTPLVFVFLVLRPFSPVWSVLTVLIGGVIWAIALGRINTSISLELIQFTPVTPQWNTTVLIGLGIPLYIVTMASQNLPGLAILKADGYNLPVPSALATTSLVTLPATLVGGHAANLSSVVAAMCTGPDCHPDPAKRWLCGPAYAFFYILLAVFGGSIVALIMSLPSALISVLAGIALSGSFVHALQNAMARRETDFAAATTFVVTASSVSIFNVGAAFWGLVAGLAVYLYKRKK